MKMQTDGQMAERDLTIMRLLRSVYCTCRNELKLNVHVPEELKFAADVLKRHVDSDLQVCVHCCCNVEVTDTCC